MSIKHTVLIIERENRSAGFMTAIFEANDYNVIRATGGSEGYMMITSYCPDIVILDLELPDMDGQRIITSVREWSELPIIVVTERAKERDKVYALDAGADDYITKPFGTGELLARMRTALRHSAINSKKTAYEGLTQSGKFESGDLTVDFDKRSVLVGGKDVHLTQNEYKIVTLLAEYPGKVLTYDYMMKNIWGPHIQGDNQILRVNMANIRRKLENNPSEPRYFFTENGVGYRISEKS